MLENATYILSEKLKQILVQLSRVLVVLPPVIDPTVAEALVLRNIEELLFAMPILQRSFLRFSYRLFNAAPFFFGFGAHAFLKLSHDQQKKYFEMWLLHKLPALREFAKALRGLILVLYFSDSQIWDYIEYRPLAHIHERKNLREKLIKTSTTGS